MEETYDVVEINLRQQRLVDILQENLSEFANASNKEDFILSIYVKEFSWQARDFESIYALKIVAEGVIEDYEMDLESAMFKIIELMEEELDDSLINSSLQYNAENTGYIYLMMNPSMKGIVKIGLTRRTPEERLEELSKATGVPTPFILVYKEHFKDCVLAERLIHSILEERGDRVSSNREFFKTETSEAIKIIQHVKQNDGESVGYIEQTYELYDDKPISKEYFEKGMDYLNGYGDYLQDYDRAIDYLERSGDLGEAQAYYELGQLHIDTMKEDELTLDVKKAIRYFEKGRVLTGKYANYCNAGLAICYANRYFEYSRIKNYTQNDANAEKCWEWFFNNLDINNSDYLVINRIIDCFNHFLVNDECSSVYKNKLEQLALPIIKKFRYEIYKELSDGTVYQDLNQYLLSKFKKYQLDRKVSIKWLKSNEMYEVDGIDFEILVEKGSLINTDYISFIGYSFAYRPIISLMKDGQEVSQINEGEIGVVNVSCILEEFKEFLSEGITIEVIGNDILEEKPKDVVQREKISKPKVSVSQQETMQMDSEKGLIGKMKSWFK